MDGEGKFVDSTKLEKVASLVSLFDNDKTPLKSNAKNTVTEQDSERVSNSSQRENDGNNDAVRSPLKEKNLQEAFLVSPDEEKPTINGGEEIINKKSSKEQTLENGNTGDLLENVNGSRGEEEKLEKKIRKKRKRSRRSRAVSISEKEYDFDDKIKLPSSQYETVIRRRAIQKPTGARNDGKSSNSPQKQTTPASPSRLKNKNEKSNNEKEEEVEGYDELVGDTSLGMKLNIIGGQVIVQCVTPLEDGRASPAQLSGLISGGDVLLSIDDKSLVNLSLDQLIQGLQPLSSPDSNGKFKRTLKLRFSIASNEKSQEKKKDTAGTTTTDMLNSLVQLLPNEIPMADQLSGQPLFEDTKIDLEPSTVVTTDDPNQQNSDISDEKKGDEKEPTNSMVKPTENPERNRIKQQSSKSKELTKNTLTYNEMLSLEISDLLRDEKQRFTSEFFSWNESYSELLRPSLMATVHVASGFSALLRRKEMISRGRDAILSAEKLSYSMEDIDKGKDLRSFKAWSSNVTLRSRASARKKMIMDTSSVIGSTIMEESTSDMNVSNDSDSLDEEDQLNGDELLLQLAAHDEIWRREMLEALDKGIEEMEEEEAKEKNSSSGTQEEFDLSDTLGSLFLGEQVSKMLSKKKRSRALPPNEISLVLFDLITHLAYSRPDEISVKGKFDLNYQTSLVPFQRSKTSTATKDAFLATQFISDEVFPKFLRSFKPLPWEERRMLWPHTIAGVSESQATSSLNDDLLTIDSAGTQSTTTTKKKNLRETIEDIELDVEARAEACFLITFYFTQVILPGILNQNPTANSKAKKKIFTENDALIFIDEYGAYLKLPMSLAYSIFLESESIVKKLIELAANDPRHKEALKDISKVNALVLYEPTMLSAIAKCALKINEQKLEGKSHLIHLCVSAYPDLRPWLVRKGCFETDETNEELEEMYYIYLSLLLHPSDGHETARKNRQLVKEWCEMSVKGDIGSDSYSRSRLGNFLTVVSRDQPEYKLYHRDLPFLMELAIKIGQVKVALKLIDEIFDHKNYVSNRSLISIIKEHLREIAISSLPAGSKSMNATILKTTFYLLEKLGSAEKSLRIKDQILVSEEYSSFISICNESDRMLFLNLLASEAAPVYTLESLEIWIHSNDKDSCYNSIIQVILERAALLSSRKEVSSALVRTRNGRSLGKVKEVKDNDDRNRNLWKKMMCGKLSIDK